MADAIDDREPILIAVVLDQRERLLLAEVQASVDRLRRVVGTLVHVAAAVVADPRHGVGPGGRVVGAADLTHTARRDAFEHDRRKRNRARLLGWTIHEATWTMTVDDKPGLISLVRAALGLDEIGYARCP